MVKALFVLYGIWGFNWVVMKEANLFFPPVTFSCYRFLLGGLLLLLVNIWCHTPLPPRRYWPWIAVTGLLQIAISNAAVQMGTVTLGAGLVSVLYYSMPLWMSLLAYVILHEPLTKRKIIGVSLSIVGMCILMNIDVLGDIAGMILTIIGAIAWAMAGIIVKYQDKVMHQRGVTEKCTMIQYTTWQLLVGSLFLLAYMACVDQGPIDWNGLSIACLVYNGLLASALCFFLWNYILTQMEASKAGVASLGVPIIGVICNIIFMNEAMYWNTVLGMALILFGIFFIVGQGVQLKKHR